MKYIFCTLFLLTSLQAWASDSHHHHEMDCNNQPSPLSESLLAAQQNISAIQNAIQGNDPCIGLEPRVIDMLKQEYRDLYAGQSQSKESIPGLLVNGSKEEFDALKKAIGRTPPKHWPGAALLCTDVPCAMGKLFGSEEAGLRALIIQKRDGFTISASQDYGLPERIFSANEIRKIDLVLRDLPATFKQASTMKEFRRAKDTSFDTKLLQENVAGYAFTGCKCILFFDHTFRGDDYVAPLKTIVHEIAHHFDFSNGDPSRSIDYKQLSGWGSFRYENNKKIYDRDSQKQLVTEYAGTNPQEDFAESAAFYVIDPEKLESIDPLKYRFLKDRVFGGKEFKGMSSLEMGIAVAKEGPQAIEQSCFAQVAFYSISNNATQIGFTSKQNKSRLFDNITPNCLIQFSRDLAKKNPELCTKDGLSAITVEISKHVAPSMKAIHQIIKKNTLQESIRECSIRKNNYTAQCITDHSIRALQSSGVAVSSEEIKNIALFVGDVLNKTPQLDNPPDANDIFSLDRHDLAYKAGNLSNIASECILERGRQIGAKLFDLNEFHANAKIKSIPGCFASIKKQMEHRGVKLDNYKFSENVLNALVNKIEKPYSTFYSDVAQKYIWDSQKCGNDRECKLKTAERLISHWNKSNNIDPTIAQALAALAEKSAK